MPLPYRIATLVYVFNRQDQVLLMKRNQEPNLGLWSPCGGKLKTDTGESPHHCAAREAEEEIGIKGTPNDFHLTGIISECGYAGQAHWLMFLFEFLPRTESVPPPIREGVFRFFSRPAIDDLAIPPTDREQIWPLFWQHRRGFFVAHCQCSDQGNLWSIEQSMPQEASSPPHQ